jgi:hypothetical protein
VISQEYLEKMTSDDENDASILKPCGSRSRSGMHDVIEVYTTNIICSRSFGVSAWYQFVDHKIWYFVERRSDAGCEIWRSARCCLSAPLSSHRCSAKGRPIWLQFAIFCHCPLDTLPYRLLEYTKRTHRATYPEEGNDDRSV